MSGDKNSGVNLQLYYLTFMENNGTIIPLPTSSKLIKKYCYKSVDINDRPGILSEQQGRLRTQIRKVYTKSLTILK